MYKCFLTHSGKPRQARRHTHGVSFFSSVKEARVCFGSRLQRIPSQLESVAELREPEACATSSSGLPRVQRAGNSVHHPACPTVPFYSWDHSLWDAAVYILPSTPWPPRPVWVFLFGKPTTYAKVCLLGKSKSRHVDSGNEPHTYYHLQVRTQQDQWDSGPSWHQAWLLLTSRVNPVLKHATANMLLKWKRSSTPRRFYRPSCLKGSLTDPSMADMAPAGLALPVSLSLVDH